MTDHSDRWPAVAAAVKARMEALGYFDNAPFVRASGLSEPFVRGVLTGAPRGNPRRSSLMRLCKALGWNGDSIDAILDGQPPTLDQAETATRPPDDLSALPSQVAMLIREARRLAEVVEGQGAEIRQLRARLDQQPPSTGQAQP